MRKSIDDNVNNHDKLAILKQQIKVSTRSVRGNTKTGYDSLLFLNTRYESFPVSIQHDMLLSPPAKTVFNNLWIWAKKMQSGSLSTSLFPEYEWIMRAANMSRGSVASSISQLRILRYITLHQKVRNENNQFIGNDYILNDEPISIPDTLSLDADYVQFVTDMENHRHKRVQNLANTALNSIRSHLDQSDDPLRPQTHIEKVEARQQANLIMQQRLFPEDVNPDLPKPTHYYGIPIGDYELAISRVHNVNVEDDTPVHNVNSEGDSQVHNVNSGKMTQVHNVNSGHSESLVHKVNAAQSLTQQAVHNVNSDMNLEVNCSSSSDIYNTTTTETEFTKQQSFQQKNPEPMIFPEFQYPNEMMLCRLTVAKLPIEFQQAMLDELAGRMADKTKESVRNPITFLKKMVKKFESNEFLFTSYSVQQAALRNPESKISNKPKEDFKISIRDLKSEILQLNQLIDFEIAQGNNFGAIDLTRQRDTKQQELNDLTEQYQVAG